jgi:hypothetical protein
MSRFARLPVRVALTAIVCAGAAEQVGPSSETLKQADNSVAFSFDDAARVCTPATDALGAFCGAAVPSAWTESEKNSIRDLLSRLTKKRGIKAATKAAFSARYGRAFKFKWGIETNDGRRFKPRLGAQAWFGAPADSFGFSQGFVDSKLGADLLSGFDVKERILLHELFHAVDRVHSYSSSSAFMRAHDTSINGFDRQRCLAIRDRYLQEMGSSHERDAWVHMRQSMRQLKSQVNMRKLLPTPTVCLSGEDRYEESFAEFASFWYLDARSKSYFPAPIADWLTDALPER